MLEVPVTSTVRRPALLAAIVNGGLVLLPALICVAGADTQSSVTVRPDGWPGIEGQMQGFARASVALLPLALVAGWRTWVHATRWIAGRRGWHGIAEAGACGFAVAVFALSRGLVTKPMEALPYLMAYGALGFAAGLAVGVVLSLTAVAILELAAWRIRARL